MGTMSARDRDVAIVISSSASHSVIALVAQLSRRITPIIAVKPLYWRYRKKRDDMGWVVSLSRFQCYVSMSSVCLFWFCDGQLAGGIYSSEEGSTESDNIKKLTPLLSRWRNSILHQCKWNMDLDENTRQEKSLIIAIDGCWSFVMCVVRLCQSCFCRLPFSSSLFHLCCQRIANLDRCRAFRKASITHSHQDWRPGKVCVNVISVFSNCAVMFQWIFERFPLTLPGTNKTLLSSGDDRKPEGDVFARTTRGGSDAKRVCCRYSQLWVFDQPLWESLAWRSTCPPQWFVVPLFEFVTSVMHQHEWTSDSSRVVATLHCLDFARYSTKHDNIRWRSLSAERRRAWDTVAARTAADMFTSLMFSYLLSMTATLTGRDFLIGLLLERTLMDNGQDLKPQCDSNERSETNR